MISDRRLIAIFFLAAICLLPLACGIRITVSSDAGSISEEISASDKDVIKSDTVIGANSLSHSIEGSGCLKESHSISGNAGTYAGVGVNIRNADWYLYDYYLSPDKASKSAAVMAGEQLDVLNARYIQAYANAFNAKGCAAHVSTEIHDPGKEASLTGYRNNAMASTNEAMASQTDEYASAPNGCIQSDSDADFTQLRLKPLQLSKDEAKQNARIDYGSMEGYSDMASASTYGITAEQQIDSAAGYQIQTKSQAKSWFASFFKGLNKTADASIKTTVQATLTGYDASASSSKDYADAAQTGHVKGSFASTAVASKVSKTRRANYGDEYDFEMYAQKDASGSFAIGRVGYYVDDNSPVASSIQGAVDASDQGDIINVAPGTYYENVNIQKSLDVKGAGASDTIVDGQQSGSVFTIGSQENTGLDMALSGMSVQNGSGTTVEMGIHGDVYNHGGGILNHANLTIEESIISRNIASWQGMLGSTLGGGIYNSGSLYMKNSIVSGNMVKASGSGEYATGQAFGGGIFNSGTASLDGNDISGNIAVADGSGIDYGDGYANGGGIYSEGNININDSYICNNTATGHGSGVIQGAGYGVGGGILSLGNLNIDDSYICGNTATGYASGTNGYGIGDGGGIFTSGPSNITGSCISSNVARGYGSGISGIGAGTGGGISSINTLNILESSISGNIAEGYSTGEGTEGSGGGIFNIDILTLEGASISDNKAFRGGGIYNWGTVNLESGSIDHNSANYAGGGIYNDGTITGNKSIVHDNNPDDILP